MCAGERSGRLRRCMLARYARVNGHDESTPPQGGSTTSVIVIGIESLNFPKIIRPEIPHSDSQRDLLSCLDWLYGFVVFMP